MSSQLAGIVLCGGRSTRMGLSKADLPFGPEKMLGRTVRLLAEVASPIVVVAAADTSPEEIPRGVLLTHDARPDRGPLEGLLAGLTALPNETDAAYVTSCDAPLLQTSFVNAVAERLGQHDIAVPRDGKYFQPLAAVYRRSLIPIIQKLLDADRLRPVFLFEDADTQEIPLDDLRQVDPDLLTLINCNRPKDYRQALAQAGFAIDPAVEKKLSIQDTEDKQTPGQSRP